jgi:hypothetical protein
MFSQLFKVKPTQELIIKLLNCFGITSLDDTSILNFNNNNSNEYIQKYKELEPELSTYYINCKIHNYLYKYEDKQIVTVIRQFLKTIHYNLVSKEKSRNKQKYLVYYLKCNNSIQSTLTEEYVVDFN